MVSFLQIILGISIPWIILIFVSSRKDLEPKGFLIGPGILIWRTTKFKLIYAKLSRFAGLIDKFGTISNNIVLSLFITFPILLVINIVRFFTEFASPIFVPNPITNIDLELVLIVLFPIILALVIHEFVHAIMAINHGVEIQYSGFTIIGVIVAAFVQMVPDSLKSTNRKNRMSIISSAITANLLIAIILIPILFSLHSIISPLYYDSDGAIITAIDSDGPAEIAGMFKGQVITAIIIDDADLPSKTIDINSANDLIANLRNIEHGTEFRLITLTINVTITGIQPPVGSYLISGSYIGVSLFDYRAPKLFFMGYMVPYYVKIELQWIINMNLIFGLFNLLPLPFTDGSKIFDILTEKSRTDKDVLQKLKISVYIISGLLISMNILLTIF